MARYFNGSNQYLECNSPVLPMVPFTMCCWFKKNTTSVDTCLLQTIRISDKAYAALFARGSSSGYGAIVQGIISYTNVGATFVNGTAYTTNQWNFAAFRCTSTTSRDVFYNTTKTVNTASQTLATNLDSFSIARINHEIPGLYYDGHMAEACAWSVSLSDNEIHSLAKGYSPLLIRGNSIAGYWPLGGKYGNYDLDRKNAYNLTAYSSPTWSDHPNILYTGNNTVYSNLLDYTKTLDVIHPTNFYYINSESNYPTLSIRNNRECLIFSPTTSQSAYFTMVMPNNYDENGCCVVLYVGAASDIKPSFSFNISFERIGKRNLDIDNNLFTSTKRKYNITPSNICGNIQTIKIPFSKEDMKRLKPGEMYTLKVQRAVDYDIGTGNAELYAIEIRGL